MYDDDEDEDDDFDYDEFVDREFGHQLRSRSTPVVWQIVAICLVIAFLFFLTAGLWTLS